MKQAPTPERKEQGPDQHDNTLLRLFGGAQTGSPGTGKPALAQRPPTVLRASPLALRPSTPRLMRAPASKLTLNRPGDEFEQDADRVADQVMRMTSPPVVQRSCAACEEEKQLQRKCAKCEEEEEKNLRRKETGSAPAGVPGSVSEVLGSAGHSLDPAERAFMESRFGHSFSRVRIHTDPKAAESARAVNALAYTVGPDIAFAAGMYRPGTDQGRKLLAHELAHVVQQAGATLAGADANRLHQTSTSQAGKTGTPPGATLQRQTPGGSQAEPEKSKCRTDMTVGTAHAYPEDHRRWASGSYAIWGPKYEGESAPEYSDKAIQGWIRWRFGTLSPAVGNRVRTEATNWSWNFIGAVRRGCQGTTNISIADMSRLVALANRDPEGRQAESRETKAGLAALRPPAPIADIEVTVTARPDGSGSSTVQQKDQRAEAERALDPTSVYEAGAAGANAPPFPARMDGPEMETKHGIGTYTMVLEYEAVTNEPLMQLAYYMNAVDYHWELYDVTQIVKAGMGRGVQEEARRMGENKQAAAAAGGASQQRAANATDQLTEETIRSWQELRDPQKAAEGGSAVDVVTRSWANMLNLELLPVSAIVAAGGQAVHWFSDLVGAYSKEKEVPFPDREGFFMVRCIAQPHARGPNQSEKRAASVKAKIVEVRQPETLAKNALEMPEAAIANLGLQKAMTSDAAEIQRLDAKIAAIREQTSGDIVDYLTHLIADKTRDRDAAPSWQRSSFERDLSALHLRLDQANKNRQGTVGLHHRPRAAFTSVVTGETYPLMLELSEVPAEPRARAGVRLMDLTVPDREPIERNGDNPERAVRNAFEELRLHGDLGRGRLVVRMPESWKGEPRELSLDTGDASTAIVRRRLQDLAAALLVLSVVIPGVGEVSAVIAAGLAVERLVRRGINGTLRLDAESVSDTLAVLGAIAQGAQLVGKLRVVRVGGSFVAAAREGEQTALKAAAEALEAARKANRILEATSTVTNVGGLIWGDLVSLDRLAKLQDDEINGKITHAEASRQRADMLSSAVRDHGIMLAGMLRPRGADRVAGVEGNLPPETAGQRVATPADKELIQEPELERRAQDSAAQAAAGKPVEQPWGVRTRFRTPDNLHDIFILNDGRIFRCSLTCAQVRHWYDSYLNSQPEGNRRQAATQLDTTLQGLEKRAASGENTPELQKAIGALDVSLREFIAPDLRADIQAGGESRGLVPRGEQLLTSDQTRNLLKYFNIDEIKALTGTDGLRSAEGLRRLASAPDELLRGFKEAMERFGRRAEEMGREFESFASASGATQADLLGVLQGFKSDTDSATLGGLLNALASGGEPSKAAAEFLGRVSRIRGVTGVTFDLTDLHKAFEKGDAVLDHGPLQKGEFLSDMAGERTTLGEGRLDVGTSGGRMPRSLLTNPVLDFVIVETNGTFRLFLGKEHSGLSGGRASVFAAGQIRFNRDGIVTEVTNGSGHYRPSEANLLRAIEFMYDRNILSRQRPVKPVVIN